MPTLADRSLDLRPILSRVPALPATIPSDSEYIEGFSTWENSDPKCALRLKEEKAQRLSVRRKHPTICRMRAKSNFSTWEGSQNNGIALLVLGWAYILSASLAERRNLHIRFEALPDETNTDQINLDYASPQELAWWVRLTRPGLGWSINGDQFTPWAPVVKEIGVEIAGCIDDNQLPPTAEQAARYLARFCQAYDLGTQCSAALAAVLSLPLHSTTPVKAPIIELPRPSLTVLITIPDIEPRLADFEFLSYYITLSLSPRIFGSCLWSIFWEPGVPCTSAGAWLGPIVTVLRPIILDDNLELLAKVLSFTPIAPLWLGITLCGRGAIINSIIPSLEKARDYPHARPNIDAAAWFGVPQSFLDRSPIVPYLRDGKVERTDVWRLRHDCHTQYREADYSHTPPYGWPPFGTMRAEDVELEIRHHLECLHRWRYLYWTWLPERNIDEGFSWYYPIPNASGIKLPANHHHFNKSRVRSYNNQKVSEVVTKAIFWWSCDQVEKGFGNTLVPFRSSDGAPRGSPEPRADHDAIHRWREEVLFN